MRETGLYRILVLVSVVGLASLARAADVLPAPEEILRKLVERSESPRQPETQAYYLCTKQTVTEELDHSGRVTSRKVKVGESRSNPNAADANKWSSQNGISFDQALFERFKFTVADKEVFNGRPTFRLVFVPKQPAWPVRRFQDRLLNRATGTLWIDEQDSELVKASIGLSESVSFGLLGAVEAVNFSFERARAENGGWLTRWTDTSFKGRKFVIPFQTRKRVECTDFRKVPERE
jgi:hypothetical protein